MRLTNRTGCERCSGTLWADDGLCENCTSSERLFVEHDPFGNWSRRYRDMRLIESVRARIARHTNTEN